MFKLFTCWLLTRVACQTPILSITGLVRRDESVEPFIHLDDYGSSKMPYALGEAHSIRDVAFNPASAVWRREGCYYPFCRWQNGEWVICPRSAASKAKTRSRLFSSQILHANPASDNRLRFVSFSPSLVTVDTVRMGKD